MKISEIKKYIYEIRFYALFSLLTFIAGISAGYFFACDYPEETQEIIEEIKKVFLSGEEMTQFQIFLFILENNVTKLFLILLLGIFVGIIPFFASFANGMILGILGYVVSENLSWNFFLLGILPHGIIEIPVLVLSTAAGMKIGKVALWRLFGGKTEVKKEFIKALKFYITVLVPLLFVAALIEAFVTPLFLS